ncbi:MAG: alpha/beta fold hydrolase [Anaerolineales bacterium]|nr:alpha/beta fold hydrolase [Anaerolineales bacterium]MCB8952434.1 alpha/beta fold hydrolase [Ardenticatenales bacterium]
MNKFFWLALVGAFFALTLGPVVVKQVSPAEARSYDGAHLADLQYTEVSFRNEAQDLNLAGMLFIPEGVGPFPAVVVIHGANTSVRDNIWYLTMTQYLQENGVAVLLPDKRGSEKSEGNWRTSSYEDLATDTLAAIDFMRNQQLVRVSQLGIIGMSQGGQISPLVAVQSPDVAFLVAVVGTSLSSYDVLHYEEVNNLREIGFLPGIADLIAYPSTYVLRKFRQRDFWDAVGNFDGLPYWQKLSIPAQVMYGSADPNVPAAASQARLEALRKDNIRVIVYEGSEHALQDPPGEGNSIFRTAALQDLLDFITTVVPAPSVTFAAPDFVFQGDDPSMPILAHSPSPDMADLYINPGAILFHDGQFHMFCNSFTGWPGVIKVGYATSPDGYHWRLAQDAPVFSTDQIPFGNGMADISSVVVLDDGTWVMYFHTLGTGEIGRAVATSPFGPWTANPQPVLTPGPRGAWDHGGLRWPSVIRDGNAFFMYYGGQTIGVYGIGAATSPDGIHWRKYNDPATTEEAFAESDPVLIPEVEWESIKADRPHVTRSADGFVMLYQAGVSLNTRGLAISDDGLHWHKYADNPVITQSMFPVANGKTWDATLLYHDDVYYYVMEIGTLSGTDLYLATHQGALRR